MGRGHEGICVPLAAKNMRGKKWRRDNSFGLEGQFLAWVFNNNQLFTSWGLLMMRKVGWRNECNGSHADEQAHAAGLL